MKLTLLPLFCCALLLTASCSSFNREWRNAASRQPSRDLAGRWEGRWISTTNGHDGKLRAVITPDNANKYHALFHATYASVLNFTYPVNFETTQHGTRVDFCGAADLPSWAGGRYATSGSSTRTDFSATYKSKYDEGRFEMKRADPQPTPR